MITKQTIEYAIQHKLSDWETAGNICENDSKGNEGTYFCEFTNNVDNNHCFNNKHYKNSIKMQQFCEEWYFREYLKNKGFSSFQAWYKNASECDLEEYDECEQGYINLFHGDGHDYLYLFNITFSINSVDGGYKVSFGMDCRQYVFFPKHKPLLEIYIAENTTTEKCEEIIAGAVDLLAKL